MNLKIPISLFFFFCFYYSAFSQGFSVDWLLAQAEKNKSEPEVLMKVYTQILKQDPYNFQVLHERGKLYYNRWEKSKSEVELNFNKALEDFNNAILVNEDYHPSYYMRSILFFHKGEFEQAFSDISLAIRLDNFNHLYYARRGFMYKKTGNFSLAEANFDMAIEVVGKRYYNPDKRQVLTNLYRDKAFSLAKLGKFRKAIRSVNKAIDFGGLHDYMSFLYKGNIYAEMGEYKKALKLYNYITNKTSTFLPVYLHRGRVLYAMDEKEKAMADWETMLRGGMEVDLKNTSIEPGF